MRLNSLRLCNFRQHINTRIDLDSGLTGIIGPNGAGKSTILEAIAWALYGMPAARGTRESIRSHRAAPRAQVRVDLDFELGGHRYLVTRGLTTAELYLDGASSPIANTITGVTELVRRRLGMSLDEFFNTYFTGQKELSVMAAMGPSERAQFLSRVLGYEKLRSAQGLVRERRRIIVAEAAGLRAGMPDPESVARMLSDAESSVSVAERRAYEAGVRRACARTALDAIAPRWEMLQRERDRLQGLLAELRVAESESAGLQRDRDRLERELGDLRQARIELDRIRGELTPLGEVVAQLQEMERLYSEEGRRRTLLESERALADDLARLRERRAKIESAPSFEGQATSELEQRRRELQQLELELEARRTEWVRDRQEAETKLETLRKQHTELKEQREKLVELGEHGICPTCARPLGDHYRSVLDLVDDQLNTVFVDRNYYKGRLEQLEQAPAEVKVLAERRKQGVEVVAKLERRLARVQLAVQELAQVAREIAQKEQRHIGLRRDLESVPAGYDAARHQQLRLEVDRLQPLDAKRARLELQLEREGQTRRERERVAEQLQLNAERLAELRRQRDAVQFSEQSFASLRAQYEEAAAELRAAELASVAAESDESAARVALDTARHAQRDLARSQTRLDELNREKRLHDELDRAYSDMRTDLNLQLRPEISELASAFLTELTDARYSELELDDQYNIIVLEDGVPKPVISGGEEDLANLVLRLAISQMIAERAGQSFSLLILDEVFGSLDEARRHNVVDLLRKLQDRFEQVILITHIESVREGLDRVITVRHDEETGASRVELETPGMASPLDERALAAGAAD
ncbi:MAG TPA: SMC family ATPase [Gemmatimonadaceae bacterium]|nr:SMC family ATPase [Gemmatimonadaceae bacterium]